MLHKAVDPYSDELLVEIYFLKRIPVVLLQQLVLQLSADGTFNGDAGNTWIYQAPWLSLHWKDGLMDKGNVDRGRDWENKRTCLLFTGLNEVGTAIRGKK